MRRGPCWSISENFLQFQSLTKWNKLSSHKYYFCLNQKDDEKSQKLKKSNRLWDNKFLFGTHQLFWRTLDKKIDFYKTLQLKYIEIDMGCSSPTNTTAPAQTSNIPQHHLHRLLQVAQITHPLNVNKKYEHIIRIDQNHQVGNGYRRTYGYHCLTTMEQLQQKVKQFWDTRTSGQDKTWKVLRAALAMPNDKQAVSYIRSNHIQMLNESVQMCVDSRFSKYEIPVFCINPPLTISQVKVEEKGLALEFEDEDVEVVIRSTKYPNGDIKLNLKLSASLEEVKNKVRSEKSLKSDTKIRFFYQGRQMTDHNYLGSYKYMSGLVIQAMII